MLYNTAVMPRKQSAFKKLWNIPENKDRLLFLNRIKKYLFEELLPDVHYVDEDWCKEDYYKFFDKAQNPWKRNCAYNEEFIWEIPVNENEHATQGDLDNFANDLEIPNGIRDRILQCKADGKYFTALYVLFEWVEQENGHAAMLFFDLKNNHQWYFDPADGLDREVCFANAFSQKSYIDGFRVVDASDIVEKRYQDSIQKHFEQHHPDQVGVCGVLVALVLVCCLRFDYWDTKRMASFICQAAATTQEKKNLIRRFLSWYVDIHDHNYEQAYIFEAMTAPSATNSRCGVYSTQTHSLCKRKTVSKEGEALQYCWQHMETLRN